MKYRQMGRWGVRLSEIGLGSYLTIGFKLDEELSRATVKAAYDGGINFFDTANAYKGAEEVLGKVFTDYARSSLFVLSKVFSPQGDGPNDRGLSAKHIHEQCEASLRKLQFDYLDLYMCHRPDPNTPLDETVRAMEDLARQGKIIYWGVSEWPAKLMVEANHIAKDLGARAIGVSEPRYSLLYRHPERELWATAREQGFGNVIFSGLAHGMLTGKYKPGEEAPAGTRAADKATSGVIRNMYWTEENKERSQKFAAMASELGATAAQLALAWCLRRTEVTSTIIGASKVEQIEEAVKAPDVEIPAEVLETLDELYPPPPRVPI